MRTYDKVNYYYRKRVTFYEYKVTMDGESKTVALKYRMDYKASRQNLINQGHKDIHFDLVRVYTFEE